MAHREHPRGGRLVVQNDGFPEIDGRRDPVASEIDKWDERREKTRITKDTIHLTKSDAEPLVEAGLLEYQTNGRVGWALTAAGVSAALPHVKYTQLDLTGLLRETLELSYFHDEVDGEVPIPALYSPGTSKMVLVLGENAGGKSFFRRLVHMMTHPGRKGSWGDKSIKPGPFPVREFIHLSMQGRASGGFVSSAIYGTEDYRSTGENSGHVITTGISTACGRAHPSIIYWDEPDIGMSAGTAAGAGLSLHSLMEKDAPLVQAAFITSHSPALVRQLVDLDPHYIYLGDAEGPATLADWFESQSNPKVVTLDELKARSRGRHKRIQHLLNGNKSKGQST